MASPSRYHTPAPGDLILPVGTLIPFNEVYLEQSVERMTPVFHLHVSPKSLLEQWPLMANIQAEAVVNISLEAYAAAWERGQTFDFQVVAMGSIKAHTSAISENWMCVARTRPWPEPEN